MVNNYDLDTFKTGMGMASGASTRSNYGLRDEIQAFWSDRAATFDEVPGHEIFSEAERRAWHRLLTRHLGPASGRSVLDLASGTGVVSHLLDELGFAVTGLDWSEAMLARAKAKAAARGRRIDFRLGDAERIPEADASFDVLVCRHLVWTLVDPAACFSEWLRVVRPGGSLVVVDGDFVRLGFGERLIQRLDAIARRWRLSRELSPSLTAELAERHRSILSRVYFRDGARAEDVAAMLGQAGFADIWIDRRLGDIHRAQARHMPFAKGLSRQIQHRYAISALKPAT